MIDSLFLFKQKTAYEILTCDWSSDVCSSDLAVLGWKEFELELLRDADDNVVIICAVENLDPMGIHTGDSITVAPAMTLSDTAYQQMRDESILAMRSMEIGRASCRERV